ncbi:hypothetical protein MTR67_027865 [Solanum verrucosum]|uniref:Endonuclease/exonuclease/phosphatase domain-containing protein n=1 Tax=Solanum verrucosum TaxID=315347 RepID=A0AAF0TZR4_SOLVR|nr:hypothetical protein MTR67_027865 [Solanum verrucosum]
MGSDIIYFAVGFKSFDITRKISRAEIWYEWVERGRNMMTWASFSQKTMEWIVHLLKEASKTNGNSVKRWKNHDHYSEIFCSRNFNRFGRYLSIINMQGKKKTIIIIPEWSFNSKWLDIATKITNFINVKTTRTVKLLHRTTEEGLLYAEAVKNNKWSTREMNDARAAYQRRSRMSILLRSVAGQIVPGRNQFLFEFPTKAAADHVGKGEWFWKSHKFHLDWWTPCSNSIEESLKEVWIRLVQIWIEAPARLVNSGQRGKKGITQQSVKKSYFIEGRGGFECTEVMGHVGTLNSQENLNFTDGQTYQRSRERDEGLDTLAQIGFKEGEGKNAKDPADPFVDEIIANKWKEAQASQHIRGENIFDTSSGDLQSKGEELDQELQDATHRDDDAMSIIQMDSRLEIDTYAEQGNKELRAVNVEEATPLNYTELPENFEPTSDSTIPLWVRQNIINLGKEFGIHFNGCEEIAEELFIKIDGKRQRTGEAAKALMLMTPKSKVSKELKNLEVGTNFLAMAQEVGGDATSCSLMKINIVSWNVKGLNDARKRLVIKSLIHNWKADVFCFQETKLQGDINNLVRDLWANRWVKHAQLEASGTRGGVILMWDSRVWEGEVCETGAYCITCKFSSKSPDFSWHMSGVYSPNNREEREEVLWELCSVRGLFSGPWVVGGGGGNFNIVRFPSEKRNCTRFNKAMTDFTDFIEDAELVDIQLAGDVFTWKKGEGHDPAARLDRFLISEEWENTFKNIKQSTLQRVISDHCPLILECGNWERPNSYFKFENWWLQTENFKEMVKIWWDSSIFRGKLDFILASKLKYLKGKLKEWSRTSQGNLGLQK